ncbi:tetratricopeptide repeat protein [Ferrimonas lipolytica]|uniref:Tetratricopeptide repeat protein n=1 Tax=Ferrimonas lipolytica TaxID=2724191 RepID=A0A6H1UFP4_9GAMM|nr:tetratricopeptide repeat protein [Ferrimonas lipolytica]QIZ77036.1 tetratricopeptide repeat protein [Ferrimonas lipolytica]
MLRNFISCVLWLVASAPVLAIDLEQLAELQQLVHTEPRHVISVIDDSQGNTPSAETERLLLLTQASVNIFDKERSFELLTQLQQQSLTATQQGWYGLLEATAIASMKSQYERALEIYHRASIKLASLSSPQAMRLHVDVLLKQGSLQRYLQQYEDAIETLVTARGRAITLSDNNRIAVANQQLGRVNRSLKNYQAALEHYQAALSLAKHVSDTKFDIELNLQISRVFRDSGDYENALSYARAAADISLEYNFTHIHANTLSDIGYIYDAKQQYNQAIHYHLLALDTLKPLESPVGTAVAQHDIGSSYNANGEFDKALMYLNSAQAVFEQRQHRRYLLANAQETATSYLGLEQPAQALSRLNPYLEQLNTLRLEQQKELLLLLSKANLAAGNANLAWQQLKHHSELKLPTLNPVDQQGLKAIAEHQLQIQLQKQQRDQQQLSEQIETLIDQRIWALPIFLLMLAYLLWCTLQRQKEVVKANAYKHQLARQFDSDLPNRAALLADFATHNGTLLLIQVGRLPYLELEIGTRRFNQLRQQVAIRLRNQNEHQHLYEVSPGLFAIVTEADRAIEAIETILNRISKWSLLQDCQGTMASIGAIKLPFQPGSMLCLDDECSLELAHLSLFGAVQQSNNHRQSAYLMLEPVTLTAPLLQPDAIYCSAIKCINNGVIRCFSSHQVTTDLWPQPNTEKERDVHTVVPVVNGSY